MPRTAPRRDASKPPRLDAVPYFQAAFAALGTRARAESEKKYLKSALHFHGVGLPKIREQARAFETLRRYETAAQLRTDVDALFATDFHELRSAAVALLERGQRKWLGPEDLEWLIGLVRTSPNWAHVDWLATQVLGEILTREPPAKHVLRWARDEDFWVRRTALLALLTQLRVGEGDFSLFERIAAPMLAEKEFFIRKAIGWVLRDVSKKTPQWTERFVRDHARELSPLSYREATRRLPAASRARLDRLRGG